MTDVVEDLVDIDNPLNDGDLYSTDDYWADMAYSEFDAFMDQMKNDIYNYNHYGHEDGPQAYAAECWGEEELERQLEEEREWEAHLNPIQAFEDYHTILINEYGMYPDSHDRYEYMDLVGQEIVDDTIGDAAVQNGDQCKSW